MVTTDYIFIFLNLIGVLIIGGIFSMRMKNSKDMFIAGRNSSWWVAGLSGYMTIFSAGTFVVWGGIAFRLGLVAVSILMMIGLALILIGMFVSGKWRQTGIKSPAEFLGIRFGKTTITLYTIIGVFGRGISVAVALYAVSILFVALIPLPEGHFLINPDTGNMSVFWAIFFIGTTAMLYTVAGGLWAVLMIDVVQFLMLMLIILLVIPFSLESVGGLGSFIDKAPDGFFHLVGGEYSFIWLLMWMILNFFLNGGDWPFVQRYISVPKVKDSKKTAFLMASLYIVTPILWMLPAMVYRVINPDANPEQAYILMSKHVLPAGMLGLMMAAMISATTSMIDSMLNVFAGVFTHDIYRSVNPYASEKKLVNVGRVFTFIFGVFVIGIAMLIPFLGGAERVVITLVSLIIGPLAIPSIWGLFSKYINEKAVWLSLGITWAIGLYVKLGLSLQGAISNTGDGGAYIFTFVRNHVELTDAIIGLIIPVSILLIIELIARSKEVDKGWVKLSYYSKNNEEEENITATAAALKLTKQILFWAFSILGIGVTWLAIVSEKEKGILIIFSILLLIIPFISILNYLIKIIRNIK